MRKVFVKSVFVSILIIIIGFSNMSYGLSDISNSNKISVLDYEGNKSLVEIKDDEIGFIIPGDVDTYPSAVAHYKIPIDEDSYFFEISWNMEKDFFPMPDNKVLIVLRNFNWNDSDDFWVSIDTDKMLFTTQVNKSHLKKVIPLKVTDAHVPLNINIPFAKEDFKINNIFLSQIDAQDTMYLGNVENGALIPKGKYYIIIEGIDSSHEYGLRLNNIDISSASSTITIDQNDVTELNVHINNNNSNKVNTSLLFLDVSYSMELASFCSFHSNRSSYYIIKDPNYTFSYSLITPDKHSYDFEASVDSKSGSTIDLNIDTDLYFKVNPSERENIVFEKLHTADNIVGIYDSFNNKLISICNDDYEGIDPYADFVNIENNSEKYHTTLPYFYSSLTLPDSTGRFDVTFKSGGGPLAIKSAKTSINIVDSK